MGMSADIPISRLHELFRYDPETGDLIWKVRQGRKSAGSVAGSQSKGYPYPYVGLDGRKLIVGRVVFAMHHGYWPKRVVFLDGDGANSRLENLSEVYAPTGQVPTVERLSELLALEGGTLRWKVHTRAKRAGEVAGGENGDGYLRLQVDGVRIPVHRVVWALTHRRWPADGMVIDHIDGNPANNHPDNLREVTWQGNAQNRTRPSKNNRTGTRVPGVSWNSQLSKYAVNLKVDGRVQFFSAHSDLREAESEALRLRREHYPTNTL